MSQQCYILKWPRPNFGIYSDLSKFINNLKTRNGLYYNQWTSQKVEAGKCESCEIRNEHIRLDLFIDTTDKIVGQTFPAIKRSPVSSYTNNRHLKATTKTISHFSKKKAMKNICKRKRKPQRRWKTLLGWFLYWISTTQASFTIDSKAAVVIKIHLLTKTVITGRKSNAAASKYSMMKFWICRVCSHGQVKL